VQSLQDRAAVSEFPGGILRQWSFPVLPFACLLIVTFIYLRGWVLASRTRPQQLPSWRAFCFVGGIFSLWIAIASPIDALDDYLLTAHMLQHFILMSIAPPLIVLSAPTVPMLRGLPRVLIRRVLRPLFAARWFHGLLRFTAHPVVAWLAMNLAYLGWHTPAAFELTFQSENWHDFEHLCFFGTSVMYWWMVLNPWPSRPRWPRWAVIPYLLSGDVVNTMLSAFLAFCGRVLYPSYAAAPRICRLTPLQDQVAAGSEMWVLNSIVFLVPAFILTMRMLAPRSLSAKEETGLHTRAKQVLL